MRGFDSNHVIFNLKPQSLFCAYIYGLKMILFQYYEDKDSIKQSSNQFLLFVARVNLFCDVNTRTVLNLNVNS